MPTRKAETYELGAVDSRSNPANFPLNRSIRCLNFAPQSSGGLRLRSGWTNKTPVIPNPPNAVSVLQSAKAEISVFPGTLAFPNPVTAGSLLIAITGNLSGASPTLSDSAGNVWISSIGVASGPYQISANYVQNAKAGATTVNFNAGSGETSVIILEVSGIPTAGALDTTGVGGGVSALIQCSPVPCQAYDFIFGLAMSDNTSLAGSGFALVQSQAGASWTFAAEWMQSTLIGNQSAPFSQASGRFACALLAFKALAPPGSPADPIHSLVYYEQFSSMAVGPQFLLFGQGNRVYKDALSGGTADYLIGLPSANPWGHFRSKNRIHIADGGLFSGEELNTSGYSFGIINWDGTVMRPTGIPVFVSGATTASTVSSTMGSFTPTQLAGYQFYAAWYNPVTQHMGNRTKIGQPVKIGATQTEIVLSGLASPPPNPEWVTAVGMTNDGGQVPYWMVDSNGNHIVVAANFSSATLALGAVDYLSELPVRNDVPGPFDKFARVGTRLFANLSGSPYLYYSNDESDIQNANYVGNPEESWPLDQAEAFPTGELPTSIQSGKLEGWFFSRSNMAIWSSVLQAQGANPWRGPWPGGCAGQRAFVETPYGRYWLSNEKQLCTFMDDGVISVSEEYELALLGKLADATLYQVQLGYILDPENLTDQIVIIGADVNGNPVVVVHDFRLKDERSPFGCGYNYLYTGITPISFAGAGYTPRTNVYDTNGKMRLWCGTKEGLIAQIEDGSNSDNGATYSADHITIINMGQNNAGIDEIEYQGDPKLRVSVLYDYSQSTVTAFQPLSQDAIPDAAFNSATRFGAKMSGDEARWLYTRLQLDAHPADGNFALTDPPFLPMPSYGCVNATVMKLGRERREAR